MPNAPHILLVDDEILAIMALEHVLIDEGFRVTTAMDGQEALERWHADRFDALVTDLRMPAMSGDVLAGRIRTQAPTLPVIIASGYITKAVADELSAALDHPLAILPKPMTVEDITGTLRRLLPASP